MDRRQPKAKPDWGYTMQQTAEAHLDACDRAMSCHDGDCDLPGHEGPDGLRCQDPSCAPYCGCQTCMVREVLHAAVPIMEEAMLDGF